jgi:hypothetical protein
MQALLESMEDMDIKLSEENQEYIELIENAPDLRDGEPFPQSFYEPLKTLWADRNVQQAWERGNEAALPEKLVFSPVFISIVVDPGLKSVFALVCFISSRILTDYSTRTTNHTNKTLFTVGRVPSVSQKQRST